MIGATRVREAIDWVDRAGIAPLLESRIRPTNRGRPRQLTVRALFVGLKLAIDHAKTACLSDVHRVLTEYLSPAEQRELGIVDRRTGQMVSVHQVRRLFASVGAVLDPSRHTASSHDHDELASRALALQDTLDRMLEATLLTDRTHHGAYALDGTGVWSWSRGKRRTEASADPDARWGSKTAKSGGQEPYFGYELHALVRINSSLQDRDEVPCLAQRIVVVPAATNCVDAVLPVLDRLQTDTESVREIVADRGYTYKNNWGTSLFSLGIEPVLDLHPTQYGPRGTHQGARIITGVPHCPATPPGLDTITRPDRLSDGPTVDDFVDRISRREQWAFRRVNTADTTGKERYECPARAGKVRCALVKPSLAKPLALPTVRNPPAAEPPTCCTQRTITVPGDVDAKARQRHYWGSRDWIAAFARRSRVEGWFGNLKSNNTEALTRGAFRVMGIAKTSLMLGIYAACTNLRLLRRWTERQDAPGADSSSTATAKRRMRRPGSTRRRARAPDPGQSTS